MKELHPKNTPETRAEIVKMKTDGMSWTAIGKYVGVNPKSAKAWVDLEYAEHLRDKLRGTGGARRPPAVRDRATRDDADRRLREIPPDTRTPAQRLLGDPIPERSALYKRGQQC